MVIVFYNRFFHENSFILFNSPDHFRSRIPLFFTVFKLFSDPFHIFLPFFRVLTPCSVISPLFPRLGLIAPDPPIFRPFQAVSQSADIGIASCGPLYVR